MRPVANHGGARRRFLRRILHNALALSDNPSACTDPRSPE